MLVNLIFFVSRILLMALSVYRTILIVYFVMSWIPGAYQTGLGQFLHNICEPYVGFFRNFIPPVGMVSFAGLAAYLVLLLADGGVIAIRNILISLLLG